MTGFSIVGVIAVLLSTVACESSSIGDSPFVSGGSEKEDGSVNLGGVTRGNDTTTTEGADASDGEDNDAGTKEGDNTGFSQATDGGVATPEEATFTLTDTLLVSRNCNRNQEANLGARPLDDVNGLTFKLVKSDSPNQAAAQIFDLPKSGGKEQIESAGKITLTLAGVPDGLYTLLMCANDDAPCFIPAEEWTVAASSIYVKELTKPVLAKEWLRGWSFFALDDNNGNTRIRGVIGGGNYIPVKDQKFMIHRGLNIPKGPETIAGRYDPYLAAVFFRNGRDSKCEENSGF